MAWNWLPFKSSTSTWRDRIAEVPVGTSTCWQVFAASPSIWWWFPWKTSPPWQSQMLCSKMYIWFTVLWNYKYTITDLSLWTPSWDILPECLESRTWGVPLTGRLQIPQLNVLTGPSTQSLPKPSKSIKEIGMSKPNTSASPTIPPSTHLRLSVHSTWCSCGNPEWVSIYSLIVPIQPTRIQTNILKLYGTECRRRTKLSVTSLLWIREIAQKCLIFQFLKNIEQCI